MTKRTLTCIASFLAVTAILTGCHRRPLDFPLGSVRVVLTNDYRMPYIRTKQVPYNYALMFYDAATGEFAFEEFCPEPGGRINSIPGSYSMLAYDKDNTTTRFDGRGSLFTIRAYTEDVPEGTSEIFKASKRALAKQVFQDGNRLDPSKGLPGYESDRVIREPNATFGGLNNSVDIPHLGWTDEEYVIPDKTAYLFSQGRLTFYGVKNTQNIGSVQVFLTNLAESKYIGTGEIVQTPVAEGFFLTEINRNYLQGHFNYFGKIDDPALVNTAYIIITDTGGGKYLYVMDVTDQIMAQEDNADIILYLDVDIPNPATGGAGFVPTVDEWEVVWTDITLGRN